MTQLASGLSTRGAAPLSALEVLERIDEGFVVVDGEWRVTYANRAAVRMLDGSLEDAVGRSFWDAWQPPDPEARRILHGAMAERGSAQLELRDARRNAWMEVTAHPSADGLGIFFRDISRRKRAEAGYRAALERYQLVAKATSDVIWDWDIRSDELFWNEAVFTVFRLSPDNVVNQLDWWVDHLHPEDRDRVLRGLYGAIHGESEFWSDEYRFRRGDGSYAAVLDRGFVARDESGEPTRMLGAMVDLTERRRTEDALRASEARYRSLVHAIAQIVWTADAEGHVHDTAAWRAFTGQTEEEVRGFGWLHAVHPDDRQCTAAAWEESLRTRGEFQAEYRLRRHDGVYRSVSARAVPVRDAEGRPREWIGLGMDIEEQKRAEDRIAAQRRILEQIATGRPLEEVLESVVRLIEGSEPGLMASVLLLDEDGVHLRNGSSPSLPAEYTHAIDGIEIGPATGSCGTAAFLRQEVVAADIAVDPRWERFRDVALPAGLRACWSTPIRGTDGAILGTFALYRAEPGEPTIRHRRLIDDATHLTGIAIERWRVEAERTRLLEAERRARAEAEAANRTKAEFLAAMSHELRTPLNAIAGYTELLSLGIRGSVTESQQDDLARIDRSSKYLLSLINDVLNFARLEAGRVEFDIGDVPVHALLSLVEGLTAPQVQTKGLSYATERCDGQLTARADLEKTQQILLNLLSNAVKFTEPGGRILVRCEADANWVFISVTDTGRGIPPEKLEHIFEPFVQVNRHLTQQSQQGVGLGLAISRDLARAMNGDLSVTSVVDKGSTFTLTLPRGGRTEG